MHTNTSKYINPYSKTVSVYSERIWTERFHKYGHTGYGSGLIYIYDQYLRLNATLKALDAVGVTFDGIRVLDVGCGVGDFVMEFAQRGAKEVIGVDISEDVIKFAEERLSNFKNIKLIPGKIEKLKFKSNYFDLVTSITVLQHITNEKAFFRAVDNIISATRFGGKILILENSPTNSEYVVKVKKNRNIVIRTREEWINIFSSRGCRLIYEGGIPQIGTRFLSYCDYIFNLMNIKHFVEHRFFKPYANRRDLMSGKLSVIIKCAVKATLLFFPLTANLTKLNILIFEKNLWR